MTYLTPIRRWLRSAGQQGTFTSRARPCPAHWRRDRDLGAPATTHARPPIAGPTGNPSGITHASVHCSIDAPAKSGGHTTPRHIRATREPFASSPAPARGNRTYTNDSNKYRPRIIVRVTGGVTRSFPVFVFAGHRLGPVLPPGEDGHWVRGRRRLIRVRAA